MRDKGDTFWSKSICLLSNPALMSEGAQSLTPSIPKPPPCCFCPNHKAGK